MKRAVTVVGCAAVALALGVAAGRGRSGVSAQAADVATQDFRQRCQRNELRQVYAGAAPEFRAGASEALFVGLMRNISEKLGAWQSARPLGTAKVAGEADKLVLQYKSQFSKGEATENFVWRNEGGKPILVGYHINSRALGL
jgi:hypothetical protein